MKVSMAARKKISAAQRKRWRAGVYNSHRKKMLAAAKRRKGQSKYGKLKSQLPKLFEHFIGMHARVRDGIAPSIAWAKDAEGLAQFVAYIGPVPSKMKRPTVGRKNHQRGYEPGNVMWQAASDNSSEAMTRWARDYWKDPNARKAQSRRAKRAWRPDGHLFNRRRKCE